jgi:hypothetical protein
MLGEYLVGQFALDVFVGLPVDLEMRRHGEGQFDQPWIKERQPILQAVGHGVFVLADEGPVLQPLVVLQLQQSLLPLTLPSSARPYLKSCPP